MIDTSEAREGLRRTDGRLHFAIEAALRVVVEAAERSAKSTELFHDKTGKTRASIRSGMTRGRGWVKAGGASSLLQSGTASHVISAKKSSVLAFRSASGNMIFRKTVHHPGTKPRPFMSQAAAEGERVAGATMATHVASAIQ